MSDSVFLDLQFYLLVLSSIALPAAIVLVLGRRGSISRRAAVLYGVLLIVLSGVDLVLLQTLSAAARVSASAWDDKVFLSELSIALYLLPAVFGGIGINIVSHVIIAHLASAERRFDRENP